MKKFKELLFKTNMFLHIVSVAFKITFILAFIMALITLVSALHL